MQAIIAILRRLKAGATASPATTTIAAVPLAISALIQILYSVDADTTTTTDWNVVLTSAVGAIGFTMAQDAPAPPVAPPLPTPVTTKPKAKR